MSGSNALITGATGFVGVHLRRYLLQNTDWVLTGTAYPEVATANLDLRRERLVQIDLRDPTATRELVKTVQPHWVFHLAAQSHIPTAYRNPWDTLENNIRGQLNLLQACVDVGIAPRIAVIGSGEEYGRAHLDELPLREDHPLRPENPYSVSKVTQDVLGFQYYASYGLPIIRMRPFNHIGPGQSDRFALPAFAEQVARAERGLQPPTLLTGNLETARDFTDVRDVVRAYYLAVLYGRAGEAYNVASGKPRQILSLITALQNLSTIKLEVVIDPDRYRPADIPVLYGSAEKLKNDTGWIPEIDIELTVSDVLEEWRAKVSTHGDSRTL